MPFWASWEHLGLNFGCSGDVLGIILEALGVHWATFWRLGDCLGLHLGGSVVHVGAFGVLGRALGRPRGPKSNFPNLATFLM